MGSFPGAGGLEIRGAASVAIAVPGMQSPAFAFSAEEASPFADMPIADMPFADMPIAKLAGAINACSSAAPARTAVRRLRARSGRWERQRKLITGMMLVEAGSGCSYDERVTLGISRGAPE
jgi:hypothetical protein